MFVIISPYGSVRDTPT